jgi:PAS domain S-box-containing protein
MLVDMKAESGTLFQTRAARYAFSIAAVSLAFALKLWLVPLTGTGAPFVLFFAAIIAASLLAGIGPGACAVALSLPLGTYYFVIGAGYALNEAIFQSVLFGIDGIVVLYFANRIRQGRDRVQDANRQLQRANEVISSAEARTRELLELAPDAFFQADLDARLTDVNQAACRLLNYTRDELVGKTIFDIIPQEDAPRLKAVREQLLVPGRVNRAEWVQKRKDGTFVPVEVSSNILPDGRWQAFVRDISERRRIEDERQVFVSFLENSPDFVGIADPGGRPIYVNPAGRRMVGLAPDYPVERTQLPDYYPAGQRAFASDVIVRSMVELGRWEGETYFRHWRTGDAIPVSDTHFLIRDPKSGRTLGMGTITRDVSLARRAAAEREEFLARERLARQQAESALERLRESEERFRLTIDEAPIGMALVALDGRFVRVNHALCEIVGYSPDELTTLTFQAITHRDDLDADVALAAQLARGEIPRYQLEKRYIRKDGSVVFVMVSASMIRSLDGAPLYRIAQIEDITQRKKADEALRLSEAKFSGIVSIAADAIITVDQHQQITIFNEGAESIFGYSRSEVIGTAFELLIAERFRVRHRQHFAEFAASSDTARRMAQRLDVFGLRKNGEEFPAEASISKVIVGGVTLFSVVLRDITERKSIEMALRRAVAAREQVLGVVAHDLRNPLTSIVQCVGLAQRDPAAERVNRPLTIISRAAARMDHLIQGLLDVSLIEAGQLKIEPERVSTSDLVLEAVELQSPVAASSGLEIRVDVWHETDDLWGNRERLHEVFENLIGNAVKFTGAGGQITVGAAAKDQDVLFWVADTGPGIAPEHLPHVFDPFWQAGPRAGRLGAGLGLAITKGIVEAHGGRIWVESEPGRGSTFWFTIPRAPSDANQPQPVSSAHAPRDR